MAKVGVIMLDGATLVGDIELGDDGASVTNAAFYSGPLSDFPGVPGIGGEGPRFGHGGEGRGRGGGGHHPGGGGGGGRGGEPRRYEPKEPEWHPADPADRRKKPGEKSFPGSGAPRHEAPLKSGSDDPMPNGSDGRPTTPFNPDAKEWIDHYKKTRPYDPFWQNRNPANPEHEGQPEWHPADPVDRRKRSGQPEGRSEGRPEGQPSDGLVKKMSISGQGFRDLEDEASEEAEERNIPGTNIPDRGLSEGERRPPLLSEENDRYKGKIDPRSEEIFKEPKTINEDDEEFDPEGAISPEEFMRQRGNNKRANLEDLENAPPWQVAGKTVPPSRKKKRAKDDDDDDDDDDKDDKSKEAAPKPAWPRALPAAVAAAAAGEQKGAMPTPKGWAPPGSTDVNPNYPGMGVGEDATGANVPIQPEDDKRPRMGTGPDPNDPRWQSSKGSWYSQFEGRNKWVDADDPANSAKLLDSSGHSVPDWSQGIARPTNQGTLGQWFYVKAPDGRVHLLQQTDEGPGAWTGRTIDIASRAGESMGYTPQNFPTDKIFSYIPASPPPGLENMSPAEQAVAYAGGQKKRGVGVSTEAPSGPGRPVPFQQTMPAGFGPSAESDAAALPVVRQVQVASSGNFPPAVTAVGGGPPAAFIMHHTSGGGGPEGVIATLNQRGLGVQYIMDREGNITQFSGPGAAHMLTGWGSMGEGLSNRNVVGMEVIAQNNRDVNEKQVAAAKAFIAARYPNTPLFGHGQVNPGHKEADEGMKIVNAINEERQRTAAAQPATPAAQIAGDLRSALAIRRAMDAPATKRPND